MKPTPRFSHTLSGSGLLVPDSPHSNGSRPAIFVGGPRDGEKADVGLEDATIFTFEAPKWNAPPISDLKPYITTYTRVAVTPGGVAIFEEEPRRTTTVIEVEIVHNTSTDPERVRGLTAEYVTRIADDRRAELAGITHARLKD